jgi:hypothetical protein
MDGRTDERSEGRTIGRTGERSDGRRQELLEGLEFGLCVAYLLLTCLSFAYLIVTCSLFVRFVLLIQTVEPEIGVVMSFHEDVSEHPCVRSATMRAYFAQWLLLSMSEKDRIG